MLRPLFRAALLLLALTPTFAQEPQYGYLVGTLNPAKSFLEKTDPADKGKYLHYHIFVTADSGQEYECALDVNDIAAGSPLIYRLVSLDDLSAADLTAKFGPVFTATGDYHPIVNTKSEAGPILTPSESQRQAAGALDYLRHPGVLKAMQGQTWQKEYAQTTGDPLQLLLPTMDGLFKPGPSDFPMVHVWTKVYVFGSPFKSGSFGMHTVHQNQADTPESSTYAPSNGTWQDGGVIIERHISFGIDGRPQVYRSLLMTKFANQMDFTAETSDPAKPALPGHAVTPATQTLSVTGLVQNHVQTFGPFTASELELSTLSASAAPNGPGSYPRLEVAVKNGAFTSDADPGDYVSTDYAYVGGPTYRAYLRAYAPMWVFYWHWGMYTFPIPMSGSYYVRVKTLDSGGYGGSSASATLSLKTY